MSKLIAVLMDVFTFFLLYRGISGVINMNYDELGEMLIAFMFSLIERNVAYRLKIPFTFQKLFGWFCFWL